MHRNAEEQVVTELATVVENRDPPGRIQRGDQTVRPPPDPAFVERREQRLGCGRAGRDRRRQRHHEGDFRRREQAATTEKVVHQQGRLARRGRALERRRGHPDHHVTAAEVTNGVAERERARDGVELVPAVDQTGGRSRVEIRTESDDEHVGIEQTGCRLDLPRFRIDGLHPRADEPHARQ
jgi:hypothetical protein